jgi:hypothetical protein
MLVIYSVIIIISSCAQEKPHQPPHFHGLIDGQSMHQLQKEYTRMAVMHCCTLLVIVNVNGCDVM